MEKTAQYSTILFTEVYPSIDDFIEDYNHLGLPVTIGDTSIQTLFYLLYAKYGNNPIANRDSNQWKFKLFSTIYQYGPTWEKKLEIQEKLRGFSEKELLRSTKAIRNRAYNPDTAPGTSSIEELTHINDQDTTTQMRAPLDAYALLWELLNNDVTEAFLVKFRELFKIFVKPESVLLYFEEDE